MLRSLMRVRTFVLISILSIGCVQGAASQKASDAPKAPIIAESLLVLPGAINVARSTEYGGVVSYQLNESFPAKQALRTFDTNLSRAGWRPTADDLFNPAGGTSLRDWGVIEVDDRVMFTWTGYWKDGSANILRLNLQYVADRADGKILPRGNARVEVTMFPRRLADVLRKALRDPR